MILTLPHLPFDLHECLPKAPCLLKRATEQEEQGRIKARGVRLKEEICVTETVVMTVSSDFQSIPSRLYYCYLQTGTMHLQYCHLTYAGRRKNDGTEEKQYAGTALAVATTHLDS
jgi:hypothetical protein